MKKLFLFLSLLMGIGFDSLSQTLSGINVQTIFPPPYSPRLKDYAPDGANNSLRVILTNTTPNPVDVKLLGEIKGQNNGVRAVTRDSYQPSSPITLPGNGVPVEIEIFGSSQNFFTENNIDITGIDPKSLISGLIPQGFYEFCIKVAPYNQRPAILNGNEPRGCIMIPITYIEPARLTMPICDPVTPIQSTNPQNIVFNWTPCVGNIAGAQITYDFYLVRVPEGQNPNDAINNAISRNVGNPYSEKDLVAPNLIFGANYPELANGLYAWMVVAKDANEKIYLQNDGKSEVCTFRVGAQGEMLAANSSIVKCKNAKFPADLVAVKQTDLTGRTIKIGNFDMTIDQAVESPEGWSGNGRITWNYVPLKVKFSKLKINAANQAISGLANGSDEGFQMPGITPPDLSTYKNISVDYLKTYTNLLTSKLWNDLKGQMAVSLPIGYSTGAGLIGINYFTIAPDGAEMGALLNVKMPEDNSFLSMAATEMCMLPDKLFPKNAVLYLVKDFKAPYTPITFKQSHYPQNDGTYAILDEDSVRHVHVEADLNLGKNVLELNDENGNTLAGDVITQLKFDFNKWNDWVATVTVPTFGIKDAGGISVKGLDAFYDHSDFRNPPNFNPPAEYDGERGNTFKGLYLQRVDVLLPKSLGGGGNNRLSFAASNMVFDSDGLTARFTPSRYPLLDYTTGKMGKLAFSVDSFEVLIVKNALIRGNMVGKIQLPISSDVLDYTCNLRNGIDSLKILVKPKPQGYNVPVFMANMKIAPNSIFVIGLVKDKDPEFLFSLNGTLTLDSKPPLNMVVPDLTFENFSLSTFKALGGDEIAGSGIYLQTGEWYLEGGLAGEHEKDPANKDVKGGPHEDIIMTSAVANGGKESKMGGFPIQLIPPKFVKNNIGLGFEFGVKVMVGGDDASLANASGTVQVLGRLDFVNGKLTPSFKGVYPSRFTIDGQFGPANVKGELKFYYSDAKYGTGLSGWGKVKIPNLATVESNIIFGNTNDYYYGYMDASVVANPGFVLVPPLTLTGFGGGLYFNMKQEGTVDAKIANKPLTDAEKLELNNAPGVTKSGLVYSPQKGAWGLKARVYMSVADARLLTASVGLEAGFSNGALNNFNATGSVNIISKDGTPDDPTTLVKGSVAFNYLAPGIYDVNADITAGILGTNVQVPLRVHFDPQNWHIKLGDPLDAQKRIAFNILDLNLPVVKAHLGAKFYIAMGNDLGGLPELPAEVSNFMGGANAAADQYRNAQYSKVASKTNVGTDDDGRVTSVPKFSILVGGQLQGSFDATVAILSVNASAILGFDAALEYGIECEQGGQALGWNGWYANAQMYAYLNGGAYIDLDSWFAAGRFKICEVTAGAILKGGIPNPMWMSGRVKVQGNVLGLIKINTGFDLAFGEQCTPANNKDNGLDGIEIIGDISPANGENAVETDAPITVTFNTSIGQDYELAMPDNTVKTFRFKLKEYKLTYEDSKNGGRLTTFDGFQSPEWVNDNQQLILSKNKHFASTSKHKFSISLGIEEVGGKGDNANRSEEKTVEFSTAKQPDYIKFSNVNYTWPLEGQNYFLKNQLPQGVIEGQIPDEAFRSTVDGSDSKFSALLAGKYIYKAVYIPKDGGDTLTTAVYYDKQNQVKFDIPNNLQNDKTYRVEIRRIYQSAVGSAINLNQQLLASAMVKEKVTVAKASAFLRSQEDFFYINKNALNRSATSSSSIPKSKVIYDIVFKTSKYSTINEKLSAVNFERAEYRNTNNVQSADYLVMDIKPSNGTAENFDDAELYGYTRNGKTQPALLNVSSPMKTGVVSFDTYIQNEVYTPLVNFGAKQVGINYGVQELRKIVGIGTPDLAVTIQRQSLIGQVASIGSVNLNTSLNGLQTTVNQPASNQPTTSGSVKATLGNINTISSVLRMDDIIGPSLTFFPLEDEPTRMYAFAFKVDQVAYHDFYAVKNFGENMVKTRQALNASLGNWKNVSLGFGSVFGNINVQGTSRSLTLNTSASSMARNFSNADLDVYSGYQSASYYTFKPRTGGTTAYITLDYKPYADAPTNRVEKAFTFGTAAFMPSPIVGGYFKF